MTDVDPKIWENPTLGAAGAGPFLDEIEAQQKEDYAARLEGREPLIAVHKDRYPKLPSAESTESTISTIEMLPVEEAIAIVNPPVESPVEEDDYSFDFGDDDDDNSTK